MRRTIVWVVKLDILEICKLLLHPLHFPVGVFHVGCGWRCHFVKKKKQGHLAVIDQQVNMFVKARRGNNSEKSKAEAEQVAKQVGI